MSLRVVVDNVSCSTCMHYINKGVVKLCNHAAATYKIGERLEQHSCKHMRDRGGCGEARLHYVNKNPQT